MIAFFKQWINCEIAGLWESFSYKADKMLKSFYTDVTEGMLKEDYLKVLA